MKLEQKDSNENTKDSKIKLIESNKNFRRESFRKINLIRNKFIYDINNSSLDENGQIEIKQKIFLLMHHFAVLSLCKREEILPLMQQLSIGECVTNYFVEANDIFNALDEFQEKSNYLIEYNSITPYYLDHINMFFMNQLAIELDLDLKSQLDKICRQQKNGNLNVLYDEAFNKTFMVAKKNEQVNPNFKLPVFDDNIVGTLRKFNTYHDKIAYRNIYFYLYENNKAVFANNFSEKDFKIFFYDFLVIIVKNKSILNISIDSQVKYGDKGNSRYKTKWVDSFLKTWK
jgi:hypothetical protein